MNKYSFIISDEHFFANRDKIIGASELPIILGLSKYCSPQKLYRIKKGLEGYESTISTVWGHRHEVNILASYVEEQAGAEVAYQFELDYITHKFSRGNSYRPATNYFPFTEFHHPQLKWAVAHPDLIDFDRKINVEAKSGRKYASMSRDGFDGFDRERIDGIPMKYYIQIQWQMLCTGLKETTLRALIDTSDEMSFEIKESPKVQEKLIEAASRFRWCLKNDQMPAPVNSDDIKKLFPEVQNESSYLVGSDCEFAKTLKARKDFLSKKKKKIENELEDISDSLLVLAGNKKYLYDSEGNKICTQTEYEKESISLSDLKEKKSDIFNKLKEDGLIKINKIRFIR